MLQGPYCCAAHDRRFVFQQSFDIWQKRFITGITGGDQHIAEEAVAPDPFHRGTRKQSAESGVIQCQQVGQTRRFQIVAGFQLHFAGCLRKLVPRADGKAVIAAIDAVAHDFTEFVRDRPLVLDGEIGNAAPCVDAIGRGEGLGRTSVEAGAAGAAMVAVRRVGRNFRRCEDGAEE